MGEDILIRELLKRPIAYHPVFRRIAGSTTAAIMLSQAYYWATRPKAKEWFYKTATEWTEETGLSKREQGTARGKLRKLPFWKEEVRKANAVPVVHYRLDIPLLHVAIVTSCESDRSSLSKVTDRHFPRKVTDRHFPLTESTTETTTETTVLSAGADDPASSHRELFDKLTQMTGMDPKLQGSRIGKTAKNLSKAGYTLDDLNRFGKEVWVYDWRWQKNKQFPKLSDIEEHIGKLRAEPLDIPVVVEEPKYGVARSMQAIDNVIARLEQQENEQRVPEPYHIADKEAVRRLPQSHSL